MSRAPSISAQNQATTADLQQAVLNGFHQCRRCHAINQIETHCDPVDESRTWNVCGRCGFHGVRWFPASIH